MPGSFSAMPRGFYRWGHYLDDETFREFVEVVPLLGSKTRLKICASLGFLAPRRAKASKDKVFTGITTTLRQAQSFSRGYVLSMPFPIAYGLLR